MLRTHTCGEIRKDNGGKDVTNPGRNRPLLYCYSDVGFQKIVGGITRNSDFGGCFCACSIFGIKLH